MFRRHQYENPVQHVVMLVLAAALAASYFLHACDALPAPQEVASESAAADTNANQTIPTITVDMSKRADIRLSPLSLVGSFIFGSGSSNQTADAAGEDRADDTNSSSSGSQEVDKMCARCSKAEFEEWLRKKVASREEEQRMRIEIIKAQILERLGLDEAPDDYHLPDDFADFADVFNSEHGTEVSRTSGARFKDMEGVEEGMQADTPGYHHRPHHHYDTYDNEDEKEPNSIKQIIVRGTRGKFRCRGQGYL